MTDWSSNKAVGALAYELAEAVRSETPAGHVAAETEAWRNGIKRLMDEFAGMTKDDAHRALGRGMVETAM